MTPTPPEHDVSVLVPARNEAHTLPSLLAALLRGNRSPAEIVVCDAGSTDDTVGIASRTPLVRVISAGPAYPGRARNLAARAAHNRWLALVDAGCIPDREWLAELCAARDRKPDVELVFGDYDPQVGTEWEVAQALVILSPRNRVTGCRPPSTASMMVNRDALFRLGGFPEHLRAAEDLLFFEALEKAGAKVVHAPRARIRWTLAPSPRAVFRRLRLYSAHHAAAGLGRTWHHRVLAMNAVGLALLLAGFAWPAAWVLLGLGGAARLWRTVMSRRSSAPPEAQRLTAGRWARAAVLLAVADAACVLGYLDYLRGRVATSPQ
ncbi:MAG: glycosyltransferase [Vicinamibacteria bacterium]|nr:glycosyltransferase [Vicinamibacteria bacterium]